MKITFRFVIFISIILLASDSTSGSQATTLTSDSTSEPQAPKTIKTKKIFLQESLESTSSRSIYKESIVYANSLFPNISFTINKKTGKAAKSSAKFLALTFEYFIDGSPRAPTPPITRSPRTSASSASLTSSTSPPSSSRNATPTRSPLHLPDDVPTFSLGSATILATATAQTPRTQVAQIQPNTSASQSSSTQTSQQAS